MTIRRVWLGSTGPFLFDDSVLYNDIDGVISPDNQQAIATDGQILVQTAPYSDFHVVRKVELDNLGLILGLGTMAYQNANAVNIFGGTVTNLTDLNTTSLFYSVGGKTYLQNNPANDWAFSVWPGMTGLRRLGIDCNPTDLGSNNARINGITRLEYLEVNMNKTTNAQVEITYAAGYNGVQIRPTDATGTAMYFKNQGGTDVGSIATSASATTFNTSSDMRLKHAITALTGALDVVRELRPVRFLWNADDSSGEGFVAQELMNVIPSAVTGEPDAVHEDGSIKPQQVDHSKLVVWLCGAVQELATQVGVLQAQISGLEHQLSL